MVSEREKSVDEATCLPLDYRNEDGDRSQAGLGSQDTRKLFPSGFLISVCIRSVLQARILGIIFDFSPSPQSLVGY